MLLPHVPSTPALDRPRLSSLGWLWRWWLRVYTNDPVRNTLNRGFALCIGGLLVGVLATLLVYFVRGATIREIGAWVVSVPLFFYAWWLNRRGTALGAMLITGMCIVIMTFFLPLTIYARVDSYLPLPCAVGIVCATLFVAPRAGLVASGLQFLAIIIRLLIGGISLQHIGTILGFWAIDLAGLTIPLIVGAALLVRTLRAAEAANASLAQLNATLEQQVAERTAALSMAHAAIVRRDAARVREVSAITHDVYNGLQYIQHTVDDLIQALRQAGISTGWLKPHIQHFSMSMGALHALAGNMRDATLLRHRALNLAPQPTDLLALVDQAVQQVDSSFRADACQLLLRLDHSLPSVWCDRERIARVLTNVLGNALKYTSERYRGRPGGQVSITLVCVAGQVCCRIQDNGIGIDPARLPELGQPFRRLSDGPDAPDGMGLGLSLCREIMHASCGTLRLESAGHGCGATVTMGLPIAMYTEATVTHTLSPPHSPLGKRGS